jgi:hypothetical protein
MEFPNAKVSAVKANFVTGVISFTIQVAISDEMQSSAEDLAHYVDKDAGKVEVRIIPQQPALIGS